VASADFCSLPIEVLALCTRALQVGGRPSPFGTPTPTVPVATVCPTLLVFALRSFLSPLGLGCCWPWAPGGIAVGWIAGTHYIRREQHLVNVRGRGGLAYEEFPPQRGSSSWNPYYPYVDNLGVLAPTAPGAGSGPEGGSREKLRRVGDFAIPLSPQHSGSVRRRAVPRS